MTRVPLGDLLGRAAAGTRDGLDGLIDELATEPVGRTLPLEAEAVAAAVRAGRSRQELLQALIESAGGVLARFADAWAAEGMPSEPIVAVGGGARHPNVLQLKANLLRRAVLTLERGEAAGVGALRLAAMAVGGAGPAEACRLFDDPVACTFQPSAAARAIQP